MKTTPNKLHIFIACILVITIAIAATFLYALTTKPEPESIPVGVESEDRPEEVTEIVYDSVEYTIEKDELSFSNKDNGLHLSQYFEKVVISDEGEKFDAINSLIQEKSDRFISEAEENEAFVVDEDYMTNMQYVNRHVASVTKNSDGVLSIRMTASKFMGDVYTTDTYGLNYDLNTGEELDLSKILKMNKSKAENYIKEESKKKIGEDFYENAASIIDNYKFEDFTYYIQENNIYLCYPSYSLAPGATGPVTMIIPIPDTK